MLLVSLGGMSYAALVENIYCIIETDKTKYVTVIILIDYEGKNRKIKTKIKNNLM